jgi:hypothetical protein
MPPMVRILPQYLPVYLKRLGAIASDESPQEGHFILDRWQRWQTSNGGRDRLVPWFVV